MVDTVSPSVRSRIMSAVKNKHTKPELQIRSLLHRLGYRFRLHRKELPSTPDLTLVKYKTVIFVHGCFWHQHKGCIKSLRPKSNCEFWNAKLDKNIERDKSNSKKLKKSGWNVITIWECELKDMKKLTKKINIKLSRLI